MNIQYQIDVLKKNATQIATITPRTPKSSLREIGEAIKNHFRYIDDPEGLNSIEMCINSADSISDSGNLFSDSIDDFLTFIKSVGKKSGYSVLCLGEPSGEVSFVQEKTLIYLTIYPCKTGFRVAFHLKWKTIFVTSIADLESGMPYFWTI